MEGMKVSRHITGVGAARESLERKRDIGVNPGEFQSALQSVVPSAEAPVEKTQAKAAGLLKFSSHAIERMQKRGINVGPDQLAKMETALQKAQQKGAKETLMLTDEAAFVVSVKNNTVITAMDRQSMKENVFTNIDSTVML